MSKKYIIDPIQVKIADMKENPLNERNHPEDQILALMESIKSFGFMSIMTLDEDNMIVCGHARYTACKRLGIEEVPCVYFEGKGEKEKTEKRNVDNTSHDMGSTNRENMEHEVSRLSHMKEISRLCGEYDGDYEKNKRQKVKEDVTQLTLVYGGDEIEEFEQLMQEYREKTQTEGAQSILNLVVGK